MDDQRNQNIMPMAEERDPKEGGENEPETQEEVRIGQRSGEGKEAGPSAARLVPPLNDVFSGSVSDIEIERSKSISSVAWWLERGADMRERGLFKSVT